MKPKSYIGITGPVNREEVKSIVTEFEDAGYTMNSPHIPMLGFLYSVKTLNGQPTPNKRYPQFSKLRELIEETNEKVFPMIHYNSRKPKLVEELSFLFEGIYEEGLCRAVQLNIIYPNISQLEEIKKRMPELQIVFQASKSVLSSSPENISNKIKEYESNIDYILIDPSGGKGREFNLESSVKIYEEIKSKLPKKTIGFAGGFTGENVQRRVQKLIDSVGESFFCIDAEGGLRDKISNKYGDDLLNLEKVRNYLQQASKVLP